ncbi:hypothetical protein VTH06DRAFT_3324 [Thermothelomyces fergusii]
MAPGASALKVKKRSSRAAVAVAVAVAVSRSQSSESLASHPTTNPSSPASADTEHRSFSLRSLKNRSWHSLTSRDRDGAPDGGHGIRTRGRRLSKSRPLSSSSHLEPPTRRGSTISDDYARMSLSTTDIPSLTFSSASASASASLPPSCVDWGAQHVEGSAPLEHDALLLKNKAPYLVVTSEYLVKTKSRGDAVALLPGLSAEGRKRGHGGSPPEPLLVIPVDAIVSVFVAETARPSFGIEVWWRNRPVGHASCRSEFFFATPAQRSEMMHHITRAMRASQQNEQDGPVRCPPDVDALVEKLHESEEPRFLHRKPDIVPVVPRGLTRKEYMSKLEDASKKPQEAPAFYLVVGTYFCHLVEIIRSKAGEPVCRHKSFGLVTLECVRGDWVVHEERFNITFRAPFQPPVTLELASRYYREVIRILGTADRFLKPAWPQLWQTMEVFRVSGLKEPQYLVPKEDFGSFKRTLDAYLAAYHCQDVNWEINWKTRFAPEFRLLPGKRGPYSSLQLLAVLRALRYNDYFTSLSFRDVDLTVLHGLEDNAFGKANVAYLSRTCVALGPDEIEMLKASPVLHQEFHALAFCSETIRQMDLGNCSRSFHAQMAQHGNQAVPSLQFLTPILRLLRSGLTKCNRLIVSGNTLPQFDVDDLAETMTCGAIQALDVSYCGLDDASLREMIVEPLSDYPGLLQSLSVSGNPGRLPAHILPGLDELVAALHDLLARNTSIQFLDLSGFSGKLDDGQLPPGAGRALAGLAANTTLTHLRIRNQNLHDEAGLLGRALAENGTLRALDCRGNNFNLTSLRFLVESIAGADRSAIVEFPLPAEERAAIWRNVLRGLQRSQPSVPLPAVGTATAAGAAGSGSNAIRDLLREEEAMLRDVLEGLFATLENKLVENRARLLGDAVRLGEGGDLGGGGGGGGGGGEGGGEDNADLPQRKFSYRHRHRHRHQRSGSSSAAGLLAMDGEDDDAWPSLGEISGIGLDLGLDLGTMEFDMWPPTDGAEPADDHHGGYDDGSNDGCGEGCGEGYGEAGPPPPPQTMAQPEPADDGATAISHAACAVGRMESPAETLDPVSEAETPPEEGQQPPDRDALQVLVEEADAGKLSGDEKEEEKQKQKEEDGDELFRKMVDDFRRAGFDV